MGRLISATWLVLGLALVLSGWAFWPGSSDVAGPAPSASATVAPECDPCAAVVDAAPTHSHWESMVAVSPLDPSHVVAAAMYADNGSAMQVGVFVSRDGGHAWTRSFLPYGDRAAVGDPLGLVNGVVDPAVAIASDGTVLVAGVGFTEAGYGPTQVPLQDVLFVAASHDGGATFTAEDVQILDRSSAPYQGYADMPRFATAPGGQVLLGWGSAALPAASALPRFVLTQDAGKAGTVEGRFAYSADNGRTWSPPRVAFHDGDTLYYPAHPAILADGSWVFMPSDYQNTAGGRVYLTRSTDLGATWSWQDTGLVGLIQGDVAASRTDGRLYYSFLLPTGDLNNVIPAVAVAEGPGGPWQTFRLTDTPVKRLIIENTLAVDATGVAHVIYVVERAGETRAEIRVASVGPEGVRASTLLDRVDVQQGFAHYFGLDARPQGAIAVWNADRAPFALHAGAID